MSHCHIFFYWLLLTFLFPSTGCHICHYYDYDLDGRTYLEEDSVCRWNALEHVTGDVLHGGVSGSTGDDIREIQHAAFHVRECPRDGLCGATELAGDVLLWLARSFRQNELAGQPLRKSISSRLKNRIAPPETACLRPAITSLLRAPKRAVFGAASTQRSLKAISGSRGASGWIWVSLPRSGST